MQPLSIVIKSSILDVTEFLDPPLWPAQKIFRASYHSFQYYHRIHFLLIKGFIITNDFTASTTCTLIRGHSSNLTTLIFRWLFAIEMDYVHKFIRSRRLNVKLWDNRRQLKRQQGKRITSQKSKINYLLAIIDTSITNTLS